MSRVPPTLSAAIERLPRLSLTRATWHGACMALGSGCLYTAPLWRPDVNLQPDIIRPDAVAPGEGFPLVFTTDEVRATVVAADPERVPLQFIWQVAGGAVSEVTTYAQGDDVWVSVLTLNIDDVADGDEVRCTVLDDNPRQNAVDVVWRVEVP